MTKLHETNDYSIFKIVDYNRSLDPTNLKKIKASLMANNLLEMCPIIVNSNMEVMDGQHRLEAAKQLGINVWYVVNASSNDEDIILLNAAKKSWVLEDYLNFYVSKGKIEYIKLQQFCKKHNYSVAHFMRIILSAHSGNLRVEFKSGSFKFLSDESVEKNEKTILLIKKATDVIQEYCFGRSIVSTSPYLQRALYLLVNLDEFDMDVFCRKIAQKSNIVRSCGSVSAYYQLFIDIYNYRNPNPIDQVEKK